MSTTQATSETHTPASAALPRGTKRPRPPHVADEAKQTPGAWPEDDRAEFAFASGAKPRAHATHRFGEAHPKAHDDAQQTQTDGSDEQPSRPGAQNEPAPSLTHLLRGWAKLPVTLATQVMGAVSASAHKAIDSGKAWLGHQLRPAAMNHIDRLNTQLHEQASVHIDSVALSAKRGWTNVCASAARFMASLLSAGMAAIERVFSWVTRGLNTAAGAVTQSFDAAAGMLSAALDDARRWLSSTRR